MAGPAFIWHSPTAAAAVIQSVGIIETEFAITSAASESLVSGATAKSLLESTGLATSNLLGAALALTELLSDGAAIVAIGAGTGIGADLNSNGVATPSFDGFAIVRIEADFSITCLAILSLIGEDGAAPAGPPPIGTVPIRYIVGEIANVVPVETVLVGGVGIVPCRVFVETANVVPVREAPTEVPRVRIVLV